MTRADSGGCAMILQGQALTDDGVEKAFGLSGSGTGGDERRAAVSHGPDGALLVAVEVGDLDWYPLAEMRVEEFLGDEGIDGRSPPERARKTHIGSLEKR